MKCIGTCAFGPSDRLAIASRPIHSAKVVGATNERSKASWLSTARSVVAGQGAGGAAFSDAGFQFSPSATDFSCFAWIDHGVPLYFTAIS
jgi:hypothetical protein